MELAELMNIADGIALVVFLASWLAYVVVTEHGAAARRGLGRSMDEERRRWMWALLRRDLRMIDTAIMSGLQQGTAFFASTSIIAIGGCFALMGSIDRVAAIAGELPLSDIRDRALIELKLLGLVVILVYAFFKFGWAYRLFNYCTILIGAVPMPTDAAVDPSAAEIAIEKAVRMNQIAGRHFNAGLTALFFALAYLGWFLGAVVLMVTTLGVVGVLLHRHFLSDACRAARPGATR